MILNFGRYRIGEVRFLDLASEDLRPTQPMFFPAVHANGGFYALDSRPN
jgi:hypothetical protein